MTPITPAAILEAMDELEDQLTASEKRESELEDNLKWAEWRLSLAVAATKNVSTGKIVS